MSCYNHIFMQNIDDAQTCFEKLGHIHPDSCSRTGKISNEMLNELDTISVFTFNCYIISSLILAVFWRTRGSDVQSVFFLNLTEG